MLVSRHIFVQRIFQLLCAVLWHLLVPHEKSVTGFSKPSYLCTISVPVSVCSVCMSCWMITLSFKECVVCTISTRLFVQPHCQSLTVFVSRHLMVPPHCQSLMVFVSRHLMVPTHGQSNSCFSLILKSSGSLPAGDWISNYVLQRFN